MEKQSENIIKQEIEKTGHCICALCDRPDMELMQSHIIPKLVYQRMKTFQNSKFRNFFDPRAIFQDGEKKPLKFEEDSEEYMWMCKHIGIVGIYDVERFCFTSSDMLTTIKEYIAEQPYAGNCLRQAPEGRNTYTKYRDFSDKLFDDIVSELNKIPDR